MFWSDAGVPVSTDLNLDVRVLGPGGDAQAPSSGMAVLGVQEHVQETCWSLSLLPKTARQGRIQIALHLNSPPTEADGRAAEVSETIGINVERREGSALGAGEIQKAVDNLRRPGMSGR